MEKTRNSTIVGLKELRDRFPEYIKNIERGESFIVVKHSRPVFKISPVGEAELWETVIDFTTIKPGGVDIDDILARL